jgi:enoyl-CoA hydratase
MKLHEVLAVVAQDASCRVVILTGAGRAFCSGQDMNVAADRNRSGDVGVVERISRQENYAGIVQRMRRMPQPIIAAVKGAAAGAGMGLALAADVRVAGRSARFLVASVRIGLSAGESGISYHLPRLIGAGRAFPILLTGRPIDAEEAGRIGLVAEVVEDDSLESAALDQAKTIMANSPFSVAHSKQIMWANLDAASLDQAIEVENRTQMLAVMTDDYKEAIRAFAAKQPPIFTGK